MSQQCLCTWSLHAHFMLMILTLLFSATDSWLFGCEESSAASASSSSKMPSNSVFLVLRTDFGCKVLQWKLSNSIEHWHKHKRNEKTMLPHTEHLSSTLTRSPFLQFLSSFNFSTWWSWIKLSAMLH